MDQFTGAILKEDGLGRVERLVSQDRSVVLRRVACGGRWPGSRWLAQRLMRRERRALDHLVGRAGSPERIDSGDWLAMRGPDGRLPRPADCLLREYVEGLPLHRATELPSNFFDALEALVVELHACGVCHNDLHKEQNVLVDAGGYPRLIDFQLASVHPSGGRSFEVRCHEDLRHIQKHRRRYLRDGRGPAGQEPPATRMPRKPLSRFWRATGKPLYHFVTRKILGRWDGEERRPSSGPWPSWSDPVKF